MLALPRCAVLALVAATLALGGCSELDTAQSGDPTSTGGPAAAADQQPDGAESGRVTEVIDGDTLHVRTASGVNERVRLIGIDAPELSTTRTGYPECGGDEAFARLRTLAPRGTSVFLTPDAVQDKRDRFGRLLSYVSLPGQRRTLQESLLLSGWARVYVYDRRPFTRVDEFRAAAAKARRGGLGVWNACGGRFDRPLR